MEKKILLFILLLFVYCSGHAQGKWELKKNEDGIEVYTRKAATGNIKELRVLCELDATKTQLISTLQDIPGYSEWVYSNKKSYILKTDNPQKITYYTISHLPWPIKDRDLIVELNINPTPEVLNIVAKGMPTYLPKDEKYVRVPYSLAVWKVTQAADNKLKVDYT